MHSLPDFLGYDFAATAALLRSTTWINRNNPLASLFSFTIESMDKLRPRGVHDAFSKFRPRHLANRKVLMRDEVTASDQYFGSRSEI